MSRKLMKDFLLTVLLSLVFTLGSILPVAILSFICLLTTAALIGYSVTKFHYVYAFSHFVIIFVVYALFQQNFTTTLATILPILLCGTSFGVCYNLKLSAPKTLCVFSSIYALNTAINIKINTVSSGQNIFENAISMIGQAYQQILSTNFGTELSAEEINRVISELTSTLLRFVPGFIVIICILFAVAGFYIFKRILFIRKMDISCYEPFSQWHAQTSVSITYFILMAVFMFIPGYTILSDAFLNVVAIMTFIFFILGLSLLEFWLKKKIRISFWRKAILVIVSTLSIASIGLPFFLLAGAGALDGCFDYRKRKVNNF